MTPTGLTSKDPILFLFGIGFKRGDEKSLTRNKNMPHNNNLNLLQIIIKKVKRNYRAVYCTHKRIIQNNRRCSMIYDPLLYVYIVIKVNFLY